MSKLGVKFHWPHRKRKYIFHFRCSRSRAFPCNFSCFSCTLASCSSSIWLALKGGTLTKIYSKSKMNFAKKWKLKSGSILHQKFTWRKNIAICKNVQAWLMILRTCTHKFSIYIYFELRLNSYSLL